MSATLSRKRGRKVYEGQIFTINRCHACILASYFLVYVLVVILVSTAIATAELAIDVETHYFNAKFLTAVDASNETAKRLDELELAINEDEAMIEWRTHGGYVDKDYRNDCTKLRNNLLEFKKEVSNSSNSRNLTRNAIAVRAA